MEKYKVSEGSWKGHVGAFVRHELDAAGEVLAVVLRFEAGNRLVEFKPEHVDKVVEPEAEPKAAE